MNHEHETSVPFPTRLSDREATTLCDFLFQLAADAEARYLWQLRRYRRDNAPTPQDPNHPWRSNPSDF